MTDRTGYDLTDLDGFTGARKKPLTFGVLSEACEQAESSAAQHSTGLWVQG